MTDFKPFDEQITAPTSNPHDGAQFWLSCNADWLPIVLGSLFLIWDRALWLGDDDTVLEAQINASQILRLRRPSGMILGQIFASIHEEPPSGCLPCDGGLYNREDYPELYAIMPAALIEDEDTFHTPDLSDRTIVGAGNTFDALVTGGELAVTLFEDHLPAHQHSLPAHDHGYDQPSGITFNDGTGAVRETALIQAGLTTQAGGVSNATGADEPHENMPPFMAFYMWIVATV